MKGAQMKNKPLDIVLLIFKIIIPILIILPLVFFTYLGIRNRIDYLEAIKLYGEQPGHYGMAEFLMALILAFINLCVFILTAICLLIAHLFKSSQKRAEHKKFFSWMLLAPVADTVLYSIILILIVNIG